MPVCGLADEGCYTDPWTSVPGCTCHASCKACGYTDSPTGAADCITCADGSVVQAVYSDGTGRCGESTYESEPTTSTTAYPPLTCTDPFAFNGEAVYGYECEINAEAACTAAGGRWELNDDENDPRMECNDVPDSVQNVKVGCGTLTGVLLGATVWFDSPCTCGNRN